MSFSDIADRMRRQASDQSSAGSAPRNFDELHLLRGRILGVLIRDARQAAQLSLEACAGQVNVAPETLNAWELGQQVPSLPQLELVAYALNVPISHFWGTHTLNKSVPQRSPNPGEYVTVRAHLIGALLRAARQQQNLTIEQLAGEAGLSAEQLTAFELGQRPIPVPVLVTLAQACQVNMAYFLENGSRVGDFLALQEDTRHFAELPPEMRRFVANPINQPYIELAMRLSQSSTSELRGIAEAILSITL